MRIFFKLILILLIIGSGLFIAKKLVETKPPAKRKAISVGAPLVETIQAESRKEQLVISAMGTVIPAKEVVIQPRVSGHIIEISPELIPGGTFRAEDLILRIDDRDYKIAVEQKKAEVARAMMELKLEKGRKAVAEREWELLEDEISTTEAGRELALRKPHLRKAVAALESARSALRKARLDVERTNIKAAFNGFVKEKSADLGQAVGPGTKLLTLAGTDMFWVQISVPVSRLPKISIPGVNNEDEGSPATIKQEGGTSGFQIFRQGRVIRLLGDLDPVGRMARLLVSVEDPLGVGNPESAPSFPLLLGAYVNVELQGPMLEDVFVIPRKAFREGDQVWILTDEKKLAFRKTEVIWRRKDDVLLRGLASGDRVITSRISAPVEGMSLKSGENPPADS